MAVMVVVKDKLRKSILPNYLDWSCSHFNMRSKLECIYGGRGGGGGGGKVSKSKMVDHSCSNAANFILMYLFFLNCAYLSLFLRFAYFFKLCLLVPTFSMCLFF